jgi:hypothetical protein
MHDHKQHLKDHTNDYFPLPLDLREIGDGKWQLLRNYIYQDDDHGKITVPKGFVTDLYSIPKIVRSLVSKIQNSNGSAVIHDYLYTSQFFGKDGRCKADAVLGRAMKKHWCPVSWWTRKKILLGLKLGGGFIYRKKAKKYTSITRP